MTFESFRDKRIADLFHRLEGKCLAVYGTGINAARVLSYAKSDDLFIVDEKKKHTYWNDRYVCSIDGAILLGVEAFIIAAQIDSAEMIYRRIADKAIWNHIEIYDMYGNDFAQLHKKLLLERRSYRALGKERALESIRDHDVISFRVDGTFCNCIPDEQGKLQYVRREGGISLFDCARNEKKKIYLLLDEKMTQKEAKKILNISDGEDQDSNIFFLDDSNIYKDLFYQISQDAGTVLHFGIDEIKDAIAPTVFGIDSFRLFSSMELFRNSSYAVLDTFFDRGDDVIQIEKAVNRVFSEPFVDDCGRYFISPENADCFRDIYLDIFQNDKYGILENKDKVVLFVDSSVPAVDRDTGSKVTYSYMSLFQSLGYIVYLLPMNERNDADKYSENLEREGFRILSGSLYKKYWIGWLLINGSKIDCVHIQRPDVAGVYLDALFFYCANAKVIYYTADFHFLRLKRQYELTGELSAKEQSESFKKLELSIFGKTEIIYTAGTYEADFIKRTFPSKNVHSIPIFTYDINKIEVPIKTERRSGIIFVGSFGHPPNVDAVEWLANEIMPVIHQRNPGIVCHIVGSSAPAFFKNYENDYFIVDGYVSEEHLEELYKNARLAVEPLRYGAGVKGKILEAAFYHLPVITTSIGAEGIEDVEEFMLIRDNAEGIAEAVVDLYNDYEKISSLSEGAERVIRHHYTVNAAKRIVCKDLGIEA